MHINMVYCYDSQLSHLHVIYRHLFEKYSSTRMTHSTVEVSKWIEWEANVLKVRLLWYVRVYHTYYCLIKLIAAFLALCIMMHF